MVDERELALWIGRLETEESSWPNYEKLAALYIIQDRNKAQPETQSFSAMYSAASAPAAVESYGDSDFLQTVAGKDPQKAWAIMDELLDTLKLVNKRVYDSVMRKLNSI